MRLLVLSRQHVKILLLLLWMQLNQSQSSKPLTEIQIKTLSQGRLIDTALWTVGAYSVYSR